ncbi:WD40-repeat-containing domain protein [Cercophora newfieldiana]|uniref:WD40-repeat-containing domain protein n=1 Tax=Cercophora newfieldiana TaxID=92897 RepID=A0AA40CYY6_9PEZI|nr:WD40-repeat-containing domain protein [Cercophora newfieldiana]
MYQLTCADGHKYPGSEPTYVLDIIPLATGLAATSSDQRLCIFDPLRLSRGPLKSIKTKHINLTTAKAYSTNNSIVATSGENGHISLWDLRLDPKEAEALQIKGNYPSILSLACSEATNTIAAGTEFADHQASIVIWDLRSIANPKTQYTEVHSDDITELNYHPTNPSLLLTGSTDGLVNIYNTTITDEDEVVIQTLNHGSIHRASFLNDTEVFALSHDEKFALYDVAEGVDSGSATLDLGDVRQVLGCQYAANVFAKMNGAGAVIGAGAQDQEMFQLFHLSKGAEGWDLDRGSVVGLPGAHGSELVRSFCFNDEAQVVFTAGEDGCIKAWRPGS